MFVFLMPAYLKAAFSSLSGRYACALYDQLSAAEHAQVLEQLDLILGCLRRVRPFQKIFCNEYSSAKDIRSLIGHMGDIINFNDKLRNLLLILQQNKRLKFLPTIIQLYRKIYENHYKISNVSITLSHPPTDAVKEKIINKLKKIFEGDVQGTYKVDPTILGGMVVQDDQYVIDLSIASQLHTIRRSLKN